MSRLGVRFTTAAMLVGLAFAVSGCWDRREIESLAVATAVALDRGPDGRDLLLTATFSIPARTGTAGGAGGFSGGGGGGGPGGIVPFARTTSGPQGPTAWVVGITAPTLAEAHEHLSRLSSRQPFWAHVRIVVVGEQLASNGLREVLDALVRNREFRRTPWLLVARRIPAYRLVELPAPFAPSAEYLARLQETLERRSASSAPQRIHQFLLSYAQPGIDPIAPGLTFEKPVPPDPDLTPLPGGEWPVLPRADQTAVFRDDRLVGWLSAVETRALLLLRGTSRQFSLATPCPRGNGTVAVDVVRFRTQKRMHLPQAEPGAAAAASPQRPPSLPRFSVEVRAEGVLAEKTCEPPLDADGLPRVEQAMAGELKDEMGHLIRKLHEELHADAVGFGLEIFRARPGLWNELAPRWRTYLPQLQVDVKAQLRIRRSQLTSGEVRAH